MGSCYLVNLTKLSFKTGVFWLVLTVLNISLTYFLLFLNYLTVLII